MPVQINEVIIRTVVNPTPVTGTNKPQPASGNSNADCDAVEQVLEIIREKQKR